MSLDKNVLVTAAMLWSDPHMGEEEGKGCAPPKLVLLETLTPNMVPTSENRTAMSAKAVLMFYAYFKNRRIELFLQ